VNDARAAGHTEWLGVECSSSCASVIHISGPLELLHSTLNHSVFPAARAQPGFCARSHSRPPAPSRTRTYAQEH